MLYRGRMNEFYEDLGRDFQFMSGANMKLTSLSYNQLRTGADIAAV